MSTYAYLCNSLCHQHQSWRSTACRLTRDCSSIVLAYVVPIWTLVSQICTNVFLKAITPSWYQLEHFKPTTNFGRVLLTSVSSEKKNAFKICCCQIKKIRDAKQPYWAGFVTSLDDTATYGFIIIGDTVHYKNKWLALTRTNTGKTSSGKKI